MHIATTASLPQLLDKASLMEEERKKLHSLPGYLAPVRLYQASRGEATSEKDRATPFERRSRRGCCRESCCRESCRGSCRGCCCNSANVDGVELLRNSLDSHSILLRKIASNERRRPLDSICLKGRREQHSSNLIDGGKEKATDCSNSEREASSLVCSSGKVEDLFEKETSYLGKKAADFSSLTSTGVDISGSQRKSLHPHRMGAERLKVPNFLRHSLSSLLWPLHAKRRKSHILNFTSYLVYLLLLLSLVCPTAALNDNQDRERSLSQSSSSSFTSWVIGSNPDDTVEQDKLFQFPDLVAPVGKLFRFQIPSESFPGIGMVSHYKVWLVVAISGA